MSGEADSFDSVWTALRLDGAGQTLDPEQTLTPRLLEALRATSAEGETTLVLADVGLTDAATVLERVPRTPVGPDADLLPLQVLGRGGMGVVHLARQISLGREVAVKRLARAEPQLVEGLVREARIMGALGHPNIVPVHALGQDENGAPVLVMKRIEGQRWSDLLKHRAPGCPQGAALEREVEILSAVCDAVGFAHSRGVLHRDVKLGNIMVGDFGEVYLLDWGIATAIGADPGPAVGTPAYMAPEMIDGGALGVWTDVYLLGATLCHALTGRPRHVAQSVHAVFRLAHASRPPKFDDDVPPELAQVVVRATSRSPGDRYPSAAAFRDAMRAAMQRRSSNAAVRAAALRVDEALRHLDGPVADLRSVRDALVGARFGLEEVLAAHPDHDQARVEQGRCLTSLVGVLLRLGEAEGAVEALQACEASTPHMPDAELRRTVDRAVRRHRALKRLGLELDLTASAPDRQRWLLTLALLAFGLGVLVVIGIRSGLVAPTHTAGIVTSVLITIALAVALRRGRHRVLATVVDQRIWYVVLLGSGATVVHRILGALDGQDPYAVWAGDLLFLSAIAAGAAIGVSARITPIAIGMLAAAALATRSPAWSIEILTLSIAGGLGVLWLALRRWSAP